MRLSVIFTVGALLTACGDDDSSATMDNATADDGRSVNAGSGRLDASVTLRDGGTDAGDASGGKADASADGGVQGGGAALNGELCHLAGNQVAVLGDSYIQLSGDFTRLLQDHARAVNALGKDDTYVDWSLSGASMNGWPSIPPQLDDAIWDATTFRGSQGIKLVVMDGGGNDVLVNNRACLDLPSVEAVSQNAPCVKTVDDAMAAAQTMFDHGLEQGVKAVVYFFYPHLPKDSLGGGPNANNILDYAAPRVKAFCEKQTKAPCYFVDMRAPFNDPNNDGWPRDGLIAFDGIHPTLAGSQILADEVWKVMQARCLAAQ